MPALTFDDFDAMAGAPSSAGAKAAPAERGASRALSFDDFDAMAAAPKLELDAQGRVGGALFSGLVSGVTGLAGLPADLLRGGQAALDYAESIGQGKSYQEIADKNAKNAVISPETLESYGGGGLKKRLLDKLPSALDFKPEGIGERALETGASFLSGGSPFGALRTAGALGSQVALPAAATIGAGVGAGVLGLGPTATAVGEGAAGLLGGGVGAFLHGRSAPSTEILRDKVRGMNPEDLERAQALMDRAANLPNPVRLGIDEAYAQVTGQNANPLTGARAFVERTPEGQAIYSPLMAERPGQIERAGQGMLQDISPTLREPGAIGSDIQAAARQALNAGPEGRQLTEAMRASGPRISPMQAGDIIQPELRGVYDAREAARREADAINYPAAEAAPERIGVDRYLPAERPGEPIVTQQQYSRPRFDENAPAPLEAPNRTAAASQEPAPQESLARFVARNGGIRLDGDAAATDLHRFNVPGLGPVARPNGKGIDDFWREELIAKGYLRPDADGGAARDITSDLLRKLQNEQRGLKSYPIGSERVPAGANASRNADDYANAVDLAKSRMSDDLTKAGIDPESLHPDIKSRVLGGLVRGEHQDGSEALEAVVNGMRPSPAPFSKSTTVEEPIYAPRFGQANPQGVIDFIDRELTAAKGPIKSALEDAKGLLMENGTGQTDLSIKGLGEARKSINAMLDGAPKPVQARLLEVRNRLDAELSVAPEYEVARSTHEQLSRPLDPFDPSLPVGRAVEQNPLNQRFNMPPEQVPGQFMAPSAAREFQGLATPSARSAQERHVTTQILNGVSDGRGDINPDALLRSIRDNHDTLTAFPDVRQRLINVASARDGLARAEKSTIIGRVSSDPDVKNALANLFDPNPLANTHAEITRSVNNLVSRNPQATAELLRLQMETMLNTARHTLQSGDNLKAGANFSVALRGHPVQRENLEAFMRGLPNGEARLAGFNRMMEIMEATGKAPAPQSNTAFFGRDMKDASKMGLASQGALAVKTAGTSLWRQFNDFAERAALGKNTTQIANILTQPNSGRLLAQLARTPTKASRAQMLTYRLTYMGRQGGTQRQDER